MATKKHHSLNIERIPFSIEEYFKADTQFAYDISRNDEKGLVLRIEKGKSQGFLNLFYTKGQVSYSVQGRMKEKAEDCWNYIKQTTTLPNTDHKTYSIRDVSNEDFTAYKECLAEMPEYSFEDLNTTDVNVVSRFRINGKYKSSVVITYYTNGTLYLQGSLTSLYVNAIIETLSAISSAPKDIIKEFTSLTTTAPVILSDNIADHISNIMPIRGTVIEKMVVSSIQLLNTAVPVEDFSCYVLGILKAVDGLISKKIVDTVHAPFERYGTYLGSTDGGITYYFKTPIFDYNPSLKSAIEKAYAYYIDQRTATFHVDRSAIEASKILSYDEALDITKETLRHIDNICKNW